MDIEHHIPSLTHLCEFTRARSKGRPTHVMRDREQVGAPSDARFFAFAYESFLTGIIEYVANGSRGGAIDRAVLKASDHMRQSYTVAAQGMVRVLSELNPTSAARRQKNVVVADSHGVALVSLRIHLVFEIPSHRKVCAFMYFSADVLTDVEVHLMETAVALAVRQIAPTGIPAIISVRRGSILMIEPNVALSPDRVSFLRGESAAYRAEWAMAR